MNTEQEIAIATAKEGWIAMVSMVAQYYGLNYSQESVRLASLWSEDRTRDAVLSDVARQAGLNFKAREFTEGALDKWRLPVVVQCRDDGLVLLESADGKEGFNARFASDPGYLARVSRESIASQGERIMALRPAASRSDARIDGYVSPYQKHWFWEIVLKDLTPYRYVLLASLVINLMGLAGVIFSMQVYDRVVPAQSLPTLYVLFGGVVLAALFDFGMKISRAHITDLVGKRADIRISDRVFGHAIRLRNSARPRSTGTFIAQLRELEQIRELVTASTITAIADLPFFLLFVAVLWMLVGPMALVPAIALIFMVSPSLLSQRKLARLANQSMRESSLRNALLVETIQGIEDVKALQAEQRFQQQWNQYNAATAESGLELKETTHRLMYWSQSVQTLVFALMIVLGAPLVMEGEMTTGALVAASILSSRMMGPLSQITNIVTRWQQAKLALKGLDSLMKLPTDYPDQASLVHSARLQGEYDLRNASFGYVSASTVLKVKSLHIKPGERIAVLGRNGAGKSALLQALAGGIEASSGVISLDGIALQHLDPADLRRDVALLTQNSRLFHGTIRDNLKLGAPTASDEAIQRALASTTAGEFVQRLPTGLDHMIMEGGLGLSGGQRQSLLLSRLILRDPSIVLLDEPSTALDEISEGHLVNELNTWLTRRTLVVATHRMAMLALVDRVIVIDSGEIVIDEPKNRAIELLSGGGVRASMDIEPEAKDEAHA